MRKGVLLFVSLLLVLPIVLAEDIPCEFYDFEEQVVDKKVLVFS